MTALSKESSPTRNVILTRLRGPGEFSQAQQEVRSAGAVVLAAEFEEGKGEAARLSSLGMLVPPARVYVISNCRRRGYEEETARLLGALLQNQRILKVGHGLKSLLKAIPGALETQVEDIFDTSIGARLLCEPSRLDSLAEKRIGASIPESSSRTLFGAGQSTENLALKIACIYRLYKSLSRELERKGMGRVAELEMKVVPLLAEMETTGLLVDGERLGDLQRELDEGMCGIRDGLVEMAGGDFNPNSPKQVAEILFDRLRLGEVSGRSTRGWILRKLGEGHPFPGLLLEHRELAKLRDAYVAPLLRKIDAETGRVYPTFWQIVGTGRMSSDMHQIPRSGGIRECFVAPAGGLLLSADYSQIELRVIGAFSQDRELLRSFEEGEDIHRRTASQVFSVGIEEVTEEQRQAAKAINFGLCYGMSARGLAAALSVPLSPASEYMNRFFQAYKGVRFYMREVVKRARKRGYVKTLFGRRIPVGGISDPSASRRSGAEKAAINAPIQGTAGGDLIKLAMLRVREGLRGGGLPARILLQMHDELLLEVKKEAVLEVAGLVKEKMEAPVEGLNVPLHVDISAGPSWGEMATIRL